MHIITISGKARHGKDTLAGMIKNNLDRMGYNTCIYHYADPLKMCATNYFNWNGEKDEAGRSLLQHIGTELVRSNNEDAWIEIAKTIIKNVLFQCDFIIIPDARFPNEIEAWENVTSIHVERTDFESELTEEQKKHPSETALNDYFFDYVVEADSLEQLSESAKVMTINIVEDIEDEWDY